MGCGNNFKYVKYLEVPEEILDGKLNFKEVVKELKTMLWPTVRPPPRAKHSLDFISQKISSLETFQAERLGSLWAYFDSVHDNDATVTVEPDTMHLTHDVRDNIIKRSKLDVRLTMLD